MPDQDPVQKALAESKKVLAGADKFQASAGGPLKTPASKPAVKPAPAPAPAKKSPSEGLLGEAESAAKGIKDKAANVGEYNRAQKASGGEPLKPYKNGGKVDKTGPAILDKGETVLPKDKKKAEKLAIDHLGKKASIMSEAMKEEDEEKSESAAEQKAEGKKGEAAEKKDKKSSKGGKHTKYARTEIEHHPNGSHTIKRHHRIKPAADGKVEPQKEPDTMAVPDDDAMLAALQGGGEGGEAPEGAAPSGAEQA